MSRKSVISSVVVATGLAASLGTMAIGHDDDGEHGRGRRLSAVLRGFNEVPTVSSAARGSFQALISEDGSEIAYRLDYSGLEGSVIQAHIHFGAAGTSGGVSVWLCGNPPTTPPPGTPPCAASGDGPEASGTITAASVVGPGGQGIAAGEFTELIKAIRNGFTYANVHTSLFTGGEIRGQIRVR
jgi:hypothetical protein